MATITTAQDLVTTTATTQAGAPVLRVVLAGRGIGTVTDLGTSPNRGRFYAWSAAFGPRGFHPTEADAIARVVAAWLNLGYGAASLMTATGTVHASRPGTAGSVPACMTDRAAQGLRVLLRTGRAVTCRHCPNA
ncbi:hypothetical protein AB0940_34575 [Streptomyces sp. NPDC006656]|uniref:hypothetical protein n=1 Tax=Streptomyces sp. NPDC006656 TaxID=3156899 RepID=UPI0034527D7E